MLLSQQAHWNSYIFALISTDFTCYTWNTCQEWRFTENPHEAEHHPEGQQSLLRKARIIAARRETSITQLLSDELEQLVKPRKDMSAKRAALTDLAAGYHLGGKRPASRDELHER